MPQAQPEGYLATSAAGSTADGVLVLHAWWGLNDAMKSICDRLAAAGFTAFAPDLYHGEIAKTIPEAETLARELGARAEEATAQLADAARFLAERAGQRRGLAVIGFSLGAAYALDLSTTDPEHIRSVVLFYGTGNADVSKSRAAYLGHFAENDPYEPQEYADALEEALRKAGRPVTFYHYPGTGHWFFEPDRTEAYNEVAASLAWNRTLAFLQHTPRTR